VRVVDLSDWKYDTFFAPPEGSKNAQFIEEIEEYVEALALDQHPFFALAQESAAALQLWVAQELVMTNAFSQCVLYAASRIENVHVRSYICDIAFGEHGRVKDGLARRSHPWLLNQLRESIALPKERVSPEQPTARFIDRLQESLFDPLRAVAAIGIGNERMIIPEYAAIKTCFAKVYPRSDFLPFLDANLNEDVHHTNLCYRAAASLMTSDLDASSFVEAAKASAISRVRYFDELTVLVETTNERPFQ
jgi:hypothetical protein